MQFSSQAALKLVTGIKKDIKKYKNIIVKHKQNIIYAREDSFNNNNSI